MKNHAILCNVNRNTRFKVCMAYIKGKREMLDVPYVWMRKMKKTYKGE